MLGKNIIETCFIIYILIINIITYILYAYDKHQAKKHKWRVKESTLLLLPLIMGSPGALIAMYTLRHKTKHKKFTLLVPMLLILNIVTAISLHMYVF